MPKEIGYVPIDSYATSLSQIVLGPASGQDSDSAHSGFPSSVGIVWSVPDREAPVGLHAEPIQRRFEDIRMRLAVLGIVR